MNEELELINIREEGEYPEPEIFVGVVCDFCNKEMTRAEFEEFENQCTACVVEDTGGTLEDNPYKELDFDE